MSLPRFLQWHTLPMATSAAGSQGSGNRGRQRRGPHEASSRLSVQGAVPVSQTAVFDKDAEFSQSAPRALDRPCRKIPIPKSISPMTASRRVWARYFVVHRASNGRGTVHCHQGPLPEIFHRNRRTYEAPKLTLIRLLRCSALRNVRETPFEFLEPSAHPRTEPHLRPTFGAETVPPW